MPLAKYVDGTWTTHSAPTTQRTVVLHPDGRWTYGDLPAAPQIEVVSVAPGCNSYAAMVR